MGSKDALQAPRSLFFFFILFLIILKRGSFRVGKKWYNNYVDYYFQVSIDHIIIL